MIVSPVRSLSAALIAAILSGCAGVDTPALDDVLPSGTANDSPVAAESPVTADANHGQTSLSDDIPHESETGEVESLMRLHADSTGTSREWQGQLWRHSTAVITLDDLLRPMAIIDLEPTPRKAADGGDKKRKADGGKKKKKADGGNKTKAAAATVATGRRYQVQVASYATRPLADRGWRELRRRAPALLGDLDHRVKRARVGSDGNIYYRLRTAPLPDRSAAKSLCKRLQARSIGCFVISSAAPR